MSKSLVNIERQPIVDIGLQPLDNIAPLQVEPYKLQLELSEPSLQVPLGAVIEGKVIIDTMEEIQADSVYVWVSYHIQNRDEVIGEKFGKLALPIGKLSTGRHVHNFSLQLPSRQPNAALPLSYSGYFSRMTWHACARLAIHSAVDVYAEQVFEVIAPAPLKVILPDNKLSINHPNYSGLLLAIAVFLGAISSIGLAVYFIHIATWLLCLLVLLSFILLAITITLNEGWDYWQRRKLGSVYLNLLSFESSLSQLVGEVIITPKHTITADSITVSLLLIESVRYLSIDNAEHRLESMTHDKVIDSQVINSAQLSKMRSKSIPFTLNLPPKLPPSFGADSCSLQWAIQVTIHSPYVELQERRDIQVVELEA